MTDTRPWPPPPDQWRDHQLADLHAELWRITRMYETEAPLSYERQALGVRRSEIEARIRDLTRQP